MPYSTLTSNTRKLRAPRRKAEWFSLSGTSVAASPIAMGANVSFAFNGASAVPFIALTQSDSALMMYDGDSGREMKLKYEMTGYLELSITPEDSADRFTMIKRVSPVMPDPLPLDSQGKPT